MLNFEQTMSTCTHTHTPTHDGISKSEIFVTRQFLAVCECMPPRERERERLTHIWPEFVCVCRFNSSCVLSNRSPLDIRWCRTNSSFFSQQLIFFFLFLRISICSLYLRYRDVQTRKRNLFVSGVNSFIRNVNECKTHSDMCVCVGMCIVVKCRLHHGATLMCIETQVKCSLSSKDRNYRTVWKWRIPQSEREHITYVSSFFYSFFFVFCFTSSSTVSSWVLQLFERNVGMCLCLCVCVGERGREFVGIIPAISHGLHVWFKRNSTRRFLERKKDSSIAIISITPNNTCK